LHETGTNGEETSKSEVCASCGKRFDPGAGGSLTAWLFRFNRCQCPVPVSVTDLEKSLAEHAPFSNSTVAAQSAGTPGTGIDHEERYRVLGLIGQGGMGKVYRVEDTRTETLRAIKVLRRELVDDEQSVERFKTESQSSLQLNHPNLVKVFDFGITADGAPYLVMELIEGPSLQAMLEQKGKLTATEAIPIFMQICEALSYVHSQNILHRDIKPGNIIVDQAESGQAAKLVDFSIAKVVAGNLSKPNSPTLTRTDELVGSPHYMSPEQCLGRKLDGRSDIYSLGCTMYHAFAGRVPFKGENPVQVIVKHLHERPADLALCGVERKLARLVADCLRKDPQDRYPSAEKLREALLACLAGRPLPPVSLCRRLRAAGQWLRRPAAINLTLFSFVCAASSLAIWNWRSGAPSEISENAWRQYDHEGQVLFDRGQLTESRQAFRNALTIARQRHDPQAMTRSLKENLEIDLAIGDRQDADKISAELYQLIQKDDLNRSLQADLDRELQKTKTRVADQYRIAQIEELCSKACDAFPGVLTADKVAEAGQMLKSTGKLVELALGPDHPIYVRYLNNLARWESHQQEPGKAVTLYRDVLERLKTAGPAGKPMLAGVYISLAELNSAGGDHVHEALACLKKAQELNARYAGPDSLETVRTDMEAAELLCRCGKKAEAANLARKVIAVCERWRDQHMDWSHRNFWTARSYALLAQINQDRGLCLKSLAMLEDLFNEYWSVAKVLVQLANLSDGRQAESYLLRAGAIRQRLALVSPHPCALDCDLMEARAVLYERSGRPGESAEAYRKSLSIAEHLWKNGVPVLSILDRLAALELARGKNKQAEELLAGAVTLLEKYSEPFDDRSAIAERIFERYAGILKSENRSAELEKLETRRKSICD
jgi:serine/threonine protein kinase